MIGIINYRMGNLRSVQKAFEAVGASACILDQPAKIAEVGALVLPGVGAFGDGMQHLTEDGWIDPIKTFIDSGRPFLGVCLGMQLLFDSSTEHAANPQEPIPGLAVIPGTVEAFTGPAFGPGRLKVPHMGWNTLQLKQPDNPLWAGLPEQPAAYFVHGYYARPQNPAVISAQTEYGFPFCSAITQVNIFATQFHPEKSQRTGLAMLKNFAALGR